MKKVYNKILFILLVLLTFGFTNVEAQTVYYVSTSGGGNGSSANSPMSFTQIQSTLSSLAIGNNSTIKVYFAPGTYNMSSRFVFSTASGSQGYKVTFDRTPNSTGDVLFDGGGSSGNGINQFIRLPRSGSSSNPSSLTIKNVTIQHFYNNSTSDQQLFDYQTTYQTLTLDNVIIDHCGFGATSLSTVHRMMYIADNHQFYLKNSTIKNCRYHYMIDKRYYDKMEIVGNSFINNDIYERLIYMENAPQNGEVCMVYNNTFSNNTVRSSGDGACIYMGGAAGSIKMLVFNNTLYNSGNIYALNVTGTKLAINNLLAGTSALTAASTSIANTVFVRNIAPSGGNIYIHTTGNNSNTNITTAFGQQFNTTLSSSTLPGKQIHDLLNYTSTDVILGKGGTLSGLSGELGFNVSNLLKYDQTGRIRPDNISIGAVDLQKFKIASTRAISSIYNSNGTPSRPELVSSDLSLFIEQYPSGVNRNNTTFSTTASSLSNGLIDKTGLPIVTFTPLSTATNATDEFTVTITAADEFGFSHTETFTVKTFVYDIATYTPPTVLPPGYTNSDDYSQTCFDFMGRVNFESSFRFTGKTNGETTSSTFANSNALDGFTIPLVGDLNGDGYPEIVASATTSSSGGGSSHGIDIFNGQTGKRISRIAYPEGGSYSGSGSHQSPSALSLIDSNGDGRVELIVAFAAGSPNGRKVASYNIVYSKDQYGTENYSLSTNWISSGNYTSLSSSYNKPIPQVVDLDGDGMAEIVVYNRIFDANPSNNGRLLLTIEDGGTGENTPYVGYDSGGNGDDKYVNFSYIYDVDFDGTYDLIAGGKVYKLNKKADGTFEYTKYIVRDASNIIVPDGRTGVADINGDGIPDIVVLKRVNSSTLRLIVWNPGFFEMTSYDGDGIPVLGIDGKPIKRPVSDIAPYIMADVQFGMPDGLAGSNSYIYIGDIDGKSQIGSDGKEYYLPEMAVLSGALTFNNLKTHPNLTGEGFSFPTTGVTSNYAIAGLTYDLTPGVSRGERLKLSFVLEHSDRSRNTGFTMFDFDNDGTMEICYRDEESLRIIKASKPHIPLNEPVGDVVLLKATVGSYTGFELPVIADIDNDASAEMVVIGYSSSGDHYYGFLYGVGAATDKFAPALPVWNQFMYDPFKINPDLTTPTKAEGKHAIDRLSYSFKRVINKGTQNERTIEYNPYNGTLVQATKFMMAPDYSYGHIYDPIVFLTEGYLIDNNHTDINKRPVLTGSDGNITISVTIGNKETALTDLALNTPVAIYKNGVVSEANYIGTRILSDFIYHGTSTNVNAVIKANSAGTTDEEKRISITLTGAEAKADGVYVLRLGDSSNSDSGSWEWRYGLNSETKGQPDPDRGIGVASRQFRDCDWGDQTIKAAKPNIFPDAATVQAYNNVVIDIFNNDILPDSYFATSGANPWKITTNTSDQTLNTFTIMQQPKAGTISISGVRRDMRITYQNTETDNLVNAVDSFIYRAIFDDISLSPTKQVRETTVYIYILQGRTGFVTCSSSHLVQLEEIPSGNINFQWYKADETTFLEEASTRTINFGSATGNVDSVYMIEPRIDLVFRDTHFRGVSFPKGRLTVKKGEGNTTLTLKWKGTESTGWYNPNNWVEVRNGVEAPTQFTPTACTNVIIPSGATYYPMLTSASECQKIELGDRAMIAGIHYLTYDDASVEIKLTAKERDRFVMMSAPLMKTYTGDYHYYNNSTYYWGDVYMNYFQLKNPDVGSGSAESNKFTATFGYVGDELTLGKAFNLRVENSTINKEQSFKFPMKYESYTIINSNGSTEIITPFDRLKSSGEVIGRFITYEKDLTVKNSSNPVYDIPVENDVAGSGLVQIVNPYMAYLDMTSFLAANNSILTNSYAVWNGQITTGFTQIGQFGDKTSFRYSISNMPSGSATRYIAPLQSFFVQKTGTAKIATVRMSPAWTTTMQENPYVLRSSDDEAETNILRIKATQGDNNSYAVLFYHSQAKPSFDSSEDMHKLFYDEIPLEVYTYTSSKSEELAINANSNFAGQDTDLGLKVKDVGQVTLDFSGMGTFGHDVYLIDKELKGKDQIIPITNSNSTYTFIVSKPNTELNDRFSLRMTYNGIGLGTDDAEQATDYSVSTQDGYIYIQSGLTPVTNVQVYSINGALVHTTNAMSNYFKIAVERQQVYIVKLKIGDEYKIQKVYVK